MEIAEILVESEKGLEPVLRYSSIKNITFSKENTKNYEKSIKTHFFKKRCSV